MGEWTLFSNHGHVLVCLANNNEARLRDVAVAVGITERAVQNILRELQHAGIVQVSKHGRCNRYQINTRKPLRHPLEAHCSVGKLLSLLKTVDSETVRPESPATKKPAAKISPTAKAPVTKPAEPGPAFTQPAVKPASRPASEQPEPEKIAAEKTAVKEAGKKPARDDVPPSTPQGSLF